MIKVLCLLSFLLGVSCSVSYAADVTVSIEGTVVDQSCNVTGEDAEKYVTFDDLNQNDFRSLGAVSYAEPVTVSLVGCTPQLQNILYTFSGQADGDDPSLLKVLGNTSGSGVAAQGLAIQILDSNQNPISLEQQYKLQNVTLQSGMKYDFKFFLRFKSVSTNVTVGDASSVLYLDLDYE